MFVNPNEVKVRGASCCCEGREHWSECSVCLADTLAKTITPTRLLVSTEEADVEPQFVSSPSTSSVSSSQDCSSDESENQHSRALVQQAEEQREALKQIRVMQTGHAAPRWFEQPELFP